MKLRQIEIEREWLALLAIESGVKFNPHHGPDGRFTSAPAGGARHSKPAFIERGETGELKRRALSGGGFSYQPVGNHSPTDGYMVSPYLGREKAVPKGKLSAATIYAYMIKNADLVTQPDHYLGAWEYEGKIYLDVSVRRASKSEALDLGRKHKQIAIWDVAGMEEIRVD